MAYAGVKRKVKTLNRTRAIRKRLDSTLINEIAAAYGQLDFSNAQQSGWLLGFGM